MHQLDLFGGMFANEPEVKPARKTKVQETIVTAKVASEPVVNGEEELSMKETAVDSPVPSEAETPLVANLFGDTFSVHSVHEVQDETLRSNGTPSSGTAEVLEVKPKEEPIQVEEEVLPKGAGDAVVFSDGKIAVKIKARPAATAVKPKKEKVKKLPQKRGRKSFKEIDAEVDLIEIPDDEILFQKQYYPISEVAKWFRVNTSQLRFWENEFDILKPRKNRKGDRLFRPEDVKNLELIYQLLRQRKFTIEGAKDYIKSNKKKADVQLQLTRTLEKFRGFLLELRANLQT